MTSSPDGAQQLTAPAPNLTAVRSEKFSIAQLFDGDSAFDVHLIRSNVTVDVHLIRSKRGKGEFSCNLVASQSYQIQLSTDGLQAVRSTVSEPSLAE